MLQTLTIEGFRCFDRVDLAPCKGFNFFVGPNAVGKTSLLEAICVLLRLQSPRTNSLSKCVRFGSESFRLDAQLAEMHLEFRWWHGTRSLFVDSVPQARSDYYLTGGRITWFSNDDLQLVRGPGAARRRYLDFLGCQLEPGYYVALRAYERALRARNFLLREERPRREIDAYTQPLLENGNRVLAARARFFPKLAAEIAHAVGEISGTNEEVEVEYLSGCGQTTFENALAASRQTEERLRQTCAGPHRDDFSLCMAGRSAAEFASEGQQRTLALALKLAQSRMLEQAAGTPPILLLDDIFGELDPARRNRLLAALSPSSQKFVTTTFLDWFDAVPDQECRISCLQRGVICYK